MPPRRDDRSVGGGAGEYGTAADFDRPVDPEDVFRKRHLGGAGHGTLGDSRAGFVRLRRRAYDDLQDLRKARVLTSQQVLLLVGLLTRAGYRPDRMGVVLGGDGELARVLGVHRNTLLPLCRKFAALGIISALPLDSDTRAGWRFTREAWLWLAGEQDHPPPPEVAARLASSPTPEAASSATGVDPFGDADTDGYVDPFALP